MQSASIDNETREPVGPQPLTIYRQDIYVLPGKKPEDNRSVIVRTTGTLHPVGPALGLGIGGVVEYFGQFAAEARDELGMPAGSTVLLFPIPAASLYDAFTKLCDQPWVAGAVRAAIADHNRKQAIASVGQSIAGMRGGR